MDEFNLELQEQAEELGFETTEDALNAGYEVDMEAMGQGVARLCIDREQEQAHEAWLKEKHEVLHLLESVKEDIINLNGGNNNHVAIDELDYVIDFIEKGEC